jgi:hypothetical protein
VNPRADLDDVVNRNKTARAGSRIPVIQPIASHYTNNNSSINYFDKSRCTVG